MMRLWLVAAIAGAAFASDPQPESLEYTVNWPSGLSLGDARLKAERTATGWRREFVLNAAVPGFSVGDTYTSTASADDCSREFTKTGRHGRRHTKERTVFDAQRSVAVRETIGGGKSELPISGCARDALAFLYFLRRELAQGRLPQPQTAYFGSPYQMRLEYGGNQQIRANEKPYRADRIVASVKGKTADITFEMFFARDAVRTPILFRVPLGGGTFTMELAP